MIITDSKNGFLLSREIKKVQCKNHNDSDSLTFYMNLIVTVDKCTLHFQFHDFIDEMANQFTHDNKFLY